MDYWILISLLGVAVALAYERDLRCKKLSYDAFLETSKALGDEFWVVEQKAKFSSDMRVSFIKDGWKFSTTLSNERLVPKDILLIGC